MMPSVLLQPVPVATGSGDEDGQLVLADGRLVAVLVRLADPMHRGMRGVWFLEAGFPCARAPAPLFDSLGAAQAWVGHQLGA
jgi:hypothetical protein